MAQRSKWSRCPKLKSTPRCSGRKKPGARSRPRHVSPARIKDPAIDALARSLRDFGFRQPIARTKTRLLSSSGPTAKPRSAESPTAILRPCVRGGTHVVDAAAQPETDGAEISCSEDLSAGARRKLYERMAKAAPTLGPTGPLRRRRRSKDTDFHSSATPVWVSRIAAPNSGRRQYFPCCSGTVPRRPAPCAANKAHSQRAGVRNLL